MVPACEALQHQAGRQKVQTSAAVFLGDGGTEKANRQKMMKRMETR